MSSQRLITTTAMTIHSITSCPITPVTKSQLESPSTFKAVGGELHRGVGGWTEDTFATGHSIVFVRTKVLGKRSRGDPLGCMEKQSGAFSSF